MIPAGGLWSADYSLVMTLILSFSVECWELTSVKNLCRREGVMFDDVWDYFNRGMSPYDKDGPHLNHISKAKLGRVLNEGVRIDLEKI